MVNLLCGGCSDSCAKQRLDNLHQMPRCPHERLQGNTVKNHGVNHPRFLSPIWYKAWLSLPSSHRMCAAIVWVWGLEEA